MQTARSYHETGYTKYLTEPEFEAIVSWVNTNSSPSVRMCIKVMAFLGLRCIEACRLKATDFSPDFSILRLELAKSHKIHERAVPAFLAMELSEYYDSYRHLLRDDYLFFALGLHTNPDKALHPHLQHSTIRAEFVEMRRELAINDVYYITKNHAKLYRISPHTLRHFVCWRYYKASGNSVLHTRDIIGHAHIETTARYIKAMTNIDEQRIIVERAFQF